jgi:tripartite-type tricarboxylate transporter receptor subunit TctC
VSRAAPDGNTLLMTSPDMLIPQHLRKLNFDLLTSFEPICDLVSAPTVIAVNSASPYRTLADLLNAARAKQSDSIVMPVKPGVLMHWHAEVKDSDARKTRD